MVLQDYATWSVGFHVVFGDSDKYSWSSHFAMVLNKHTIM